MDKPIKHPSPQDLLLHLDLLVLKLLHLGLIPGLQDPHLMSTLQLLHLGNLSNLSLCLGHQDHRRLLLLLNLKDRSLTLCIDPRQEVDACREDQDMENPWALSIMDGLNNAT